MLAFEFLHTISSSSPVLMRNPENMVERELNTQLITVVMSSN